jgi:hypothetical protein
MPELAPVRRAKFPRLGEAELRRLIARDARRYFPDVRCEQTISVARLGTGAGKDTILIARAATRLIEELCEGGVEAGWEVDQIVPAYEAWARAARTHTGKSVASGRMVVVTDTTAEILELRQGALVSVRRASLRIGFDPLVHRLSADGQAGSGRIVLAGSAPATEDAAAALAAHDIPYTALGGGGVLDTDAADRVAADYAPVVRRLALVPERLYAAAERRGRAVARTLAVAAIGCVIAGACFLRLDLEREIEVVEAKRRAIKPSVDRMMLAREAIGALELRVSAIDSVAHGPQWSSVIAAVAAHLPNDAHLVAFRGAADSLQIEGLATQAAGVFEAIQRAPGVSGVRSSAPIRQELDSTQRPIERFTLTLRLNTGQSTRAESAAVERGRQ